MHTVRQSRIALSTIRTALLVALCGVVGTSASATATDKDNDNDHDARKDVRLPALGPDAVVPACYNANTGALRVVTPWNRNGSPSCRPPEPWDSTNVPANGWSKTTCNAGGQFECRAAELFTEIQ